MKHEASYKYNHYPDKKNQKQIDTFGLIVERIESDTQPLENKY